ncbi:zinc finger protein 420-like [Acanthochromis polyacanthus]|uniref:zinc finger protein 420-like n=1 Tax=Acanthochromis polyacanthus TaxID=80966 RepID=UPI000B900488|nr:zinc finger protein 420-like [Acanthochromis polyacanthus]
MVKTAKMELLRALVSECLSAAAEEIFKIVERTIVEYEEEMSCSKWVVDSHHRLLDVATSHSEDSIQMCATDEQQQQPPASVNFSVCWEEPDNTRRTAELTTDCPSIKRGQPHTSPATDDDHSDQDTPVDSEEDDVKRECDSKTPQEILNVKKPFKCPVCLGGFSSKKTMVRHIKKHPDNKRSFYQCQFCDRNFCHKSEFIIHTRIHTNAKSHRCQDFEKSFKQRDSLFIHRQQHTEEKPYLDFSEKPGTKTHLRSVTADSKMESELELRQDESEIKAFPLTVTPYDKSEFDQESLQPLCLYEIQTVADIDKDSSTVFALDHIKREAGPDSGADEQRLLSASPAQKETEDRQLKHINVTNVLPRRTAGKSTEFIIQFEAGTAQKPYKCPCCTKCFSLTKTLIRHIKIHTADKPYQCQFCGRNFCQKSDLVNHTRIHTGERPYQCQECNKSFTQKGNLVVHMRKHTGEKPYQCQECRCSFNQKSAYEWHMQSHR